MLERAQHRDPGCGALLMRPYYRLSSGEDPDDPKKTPSTQGVSHPSEDLAYSVELWATDLKSIAEILAMTCTVGIGYAAYYAAAREFPDRYVVFRDNDRIIARWNPTED